MIDTTPMDGQTIVKVSIPPIRTSVQHGVVFKEAVQPECPLGFEHVIMMLGNPVGEEVSESVKHGEKLINSLSKGTCAFTSE